MAKPFQFEFLLHLAVDKREEAAQGIGLAANRLHQARDRQTQVEAYREEYRTRLTRTGMQGMRVYQWNDFQMFLGRLDTAVEQQMAEVVRCEQALEMAKAAWLEREREVKAYETLRERHLEREVKRENRIDQKLSDEWASNLQHKRPA